MTFVCVRVEPDPAREDPIILQRAHDGDQGKRETKRTKITTGNNGYEIELGGFSAYGRGADSLIAAEQLDVIFAKKKNIANGVLAPKTKYAPRSDVRLVKKSGDKIQAILAHAQAASLPLAPSLIEDEDLVFFKDRAGTCYHVEMRGTRTKEGIFFKAKDVGKVFQSPNFVKGLTDPRNAYIKGFIMWILLCILSTITLSASLSLQEQAPGGSIPLQEHDHHSPSNQDQHSETKRRPHQLSQQVFLTFNGLMSALHRTRTGIAGEFVDWVNTVVFTLAYGTPEQKEELVEELCRADNNFFMAFTKVVLNDLSCLYLIETPLHKDGKAVFKFGRSSKFKDQVRRQRSA